MRIFTPQNEYVMRKLLYLVIGLLFVFALPSGAQPECVFTHYSSEEGLSQNTVMNILQDRKGNMWFATWDGINKFDGYDFRTYKAKFDNRINLTNNRVDYMYEDRYGFLWLLTYDNQAWRFNPRTEVFEHVPAMKEEGSRFVVTSIKVLPCGSVWLLSRKKGLSASRPIRRVFAFRQRCIQLITVCSRPHAYMMFMRMLPEMSGC